MDLAKAAIAITGAGQGLGQQMALSLAHYGADLALIDLSLEHLVETQNACQQMGVTARCYQANVTNEAEVIDTFTQINTDFERLNALINNAGVMRDGMFVKCKQGELSTMSLEQFQSVMDVNVTGTFLCAREATKVMIQTESEGVLINISSVARAGNIGQTNYSASKAAVATMSKVWAKELGRYGIRAVAIAPGVIKTAMTEQIKPQAMERLLSMIPLGRLGQPKEIADTVKFVLENDFVTGRVLEIDGGMRM